MEKSKAESTMIAIIKALNEDTELQEVRKQIELLKYRKIKHIKEIEEGLCNYIRQQ